MGGGQSQPGLTEDVLEDYVALTYLNKGEVLYLMKKFRSIDPSKIKADLDYRFPREEVIEKFKVLKNNPFQDRFFKVFSSKDDGCFSFEDLLDMCSAMSSECPPEVKAAWAFKIFDLDDDQQITAGDIVGIIERLTSDQQNTDRCLDSESKSKIADIILEEMKLDNSGSIGLNEFRIITSRLPEFANTFYFRL